MHKYHSFPSAKPQSALTREWDAIAPFRDDQLRRSEDLSFSQILLPWITQRIKDEDRVADVGCGTGQLTSQLRRRGASVYGLDPSAASVTIARAHDPGGVYEIATVEDWVATHPSARVDLAVANMVIMDAIDLAGFTRAIARLASGGRILMTFTHPSFWPFYWGYASDRAFDYLRETLVEAPFRTATRSYELSTTHIHRPLSKYLEEFRLAGLDIRALEELRGPEAPEVFPFPRFVGVEARVPAIR